MYLPLRTDARADTEPTVINALMVDQNSLTTNIKSGFLLQYNVDFSQF